ncbi:MAG: hypothetical protein GH158_04365 [Dehalococcoidia bacterium]|nr:hypothetical protein [Dehalococcoidia bacterium]
MEEIRKSEFLSVVEETRLRLKDNSEWRARYASYAEKISDNLCFIKSVRSSFHEWSPLKVYLNVTSAKTAKNSVSFELRYMGQTVANLSGKTDKLHKLSTNNYETTNLRDFGCNIPLSGANWYGEDAAKFRGFFKNRKGNRNIGDHKKNEEHRLESLLLTEFSRIKNKTIRHIKSVTIGRVRFPMPTPISASNHKAIKYSGTNGGGIDILARTGTGGKATRLCILELKDENIKSEPPKEAIKQAIAYATFIRELLRSDAGAAWWKLFGSGGKIPEPLELYAACVMPSGLYNDYSFSNMDLDIERDIIKLHYLYFNEENNRITIKSGNTTLAVTE